MNIFGKTRGQREIDWTSGEKAVQLAEALHHHAAVCLVVFEVKVENIRERTNKISTTDVAHRHKSTGEYNNDRAPPLSYFSYKFFF